MFTAKDGATQTAKNVTILRSLSQIKFKEDLKVVNMAQQVDPEHCSHASVNRVLDEWICNNCPARFKPVNPKHFTKWQK
jgi:F420-0:gamma-glutamyl ligase-like protein